MTMMMRLVQVVHGLLLLIAAAEGFTTTKAPTVSLHRNAVEGFTAKAPVPVSFYRKQTAHPRYYATTQLSASSSSSSSSSTTTDSSSSSFSKVSKTTKRARDLVLSLVQDEKCYTSEQGARAFGDVCAANVIIEDCFFPQPFNGVTEARKYMLERVEQRKGKEDAAIRIDRISDGDTACGFAWTWTCGNEEGLRGTTFVQLNDAGEISYIQEIPEPIWKPGDFTKDLLKAILKDAKPTPPEPFEKKNPTVANELARYFFQDLQYADPNESNDEFMRFVDDDIFYRDFNYENAMRGPEQVRQFVEDFTFPGLEFFPVLFDDGVDSTCFTWEVVLEGSPDTIKGMSFYELDPESRKVVYVRDVPESAIKPPLLGTWARDFRPGLGVFQGVPIGSRPGGK